LLNAINAPQKGRCDVLAKPIPDEYRAATPYMIVSDGAKAIEFYKSAFGATELVRLADDTGKVMHAELRIGNSPIMLADEFPEMGYRSPQSLGGSPVSILLYVADVDAQVTRAIAAGAKDTMPVADQFDGDRRGTLTDPFGHVWLVATRKEDISLEEMRRRFETMMKQGEFK
jgi:PhnB protein